MDNQTMNSNAVKGGQAANSNDMEWDKGQINQDQQFPAPARPPQPKNPPYGGLVKRVAGEKISIPVVIGSFAQALRRPISVPGEDWVLSHKWGCYVRGLRETSSASDPMEE
jgi:hypothetical protein